MLVMYRNLDGFKKHWKVAKHAIVNQRAQNVLRNDSHTLKPFFNSWNCYPMNWIYRLDGAVKRLRKIFSGGPLSTVFLKLLLVAIACFWLWFFREDFMTPP